MRSSQSMLRCCYADVVNLTAYEQLISFCHHKTSAVYVLCVTTTIPRNIKHSRYAL